MLSYSVHMGLNITPEHIELSGRDAIDVVAYQVGPLSEELRTEAARQAEDFMVDHRGSVRATLDRFTDKKPLRYAWWQREQQRRANERFKNDQEVRERFEQEPPVILPQDRGDLLERILPLMKSSELEELRIVFDSAHTRDVGLFFAGMADWEDRQVARAKHRLEQVFPRLKKPFPDLTLEQFLHDHMTESLFFMYDQQRETDPKKFIYGLFDAEFEASKIRISQGHRNRYLGHVTVLADHMFQRTKT
jgi:hypothetical protein